MSKMLFAILINGLSMSHAFGASLSATNDGIYIAVASCWNQDDDPIPYDGRFFWEAFCNTGAVTMSYPNNSYGVKISMNGPDGKEVEKTRAGKTFGSKWDKLHSYKDDHLHTEVAQGPYGPGPFTGAPPWSPPKDLFKMEEPGVYTMEIQMQMFKYSASQDPAVWQTNLIRFAPIKINVKKPVDAKK